MRRNVSAWMGAVVLMLAVSSCGSEKTAASAAIGTAETAWTAVHEQIAKVMPAESKAIDDAIAGAKAKLESGDAKAALAAAQAVPGRITELTSALAAKQAELTGAWDGLNAALPGVVDMAQKRVDALAKSRKLPAGLDAATVDGAKAQLEQAKGLWTEAVTAQQNGQLAEAVSKAIDVRGLMRSVLAALKLPVPAVLA